jgi:hypothetical protein
VIFVLRLNGKKTSASICGVLDNSLPFCGNDEGCDKSGMVAANH